MRTLLLLLYPCHDLREIHHYYVIRCSFTSPMIIYNGWGSESKLVLSLPNVYPLTPFDLRGVVISMSDMRTHPPRGVLMAAVVWVTEARFLNAHKCFILSIKSSLHLYFLTFIIFVVLAASVRHFLEFFSLFPSSSRVFSNLKYAFLFQWPLCYSLRSKKLCLG